MAVLEKKETPIWSPSNQASRRNGTMRAMKYGSVCSGIEAATAAWHPLGWKPQWFAEIEPFPSAVLAHHWADVPNLGDFTKITDEVLRERPIELLVGGTPCQGFSGAGLREGLADDRSNLALEFLRLAQRARPKWVVWENVLGVLSSFSGQETDEEGGEWEEGEDFWCFIDALEKLGYGWSYRTLDAEYFGVAQRRRRVFVVGCFGDWRPAAAVLFERESLRWNSPPSGTKRKEVAGTLGGGSSSRGWCDDLDRSGAFIPEVAHTLRAEGFYASEDGTGRGSPLVTGALTSSIGGSDDNNDAQANHLIPFDLTQITHPENRSRPEPGDPSPALNSTAQAAIAFHATQDPISGSTAPALGSEHTGGVGVQAENLVRRLLPIEWERLFGFKDDYTNIPGASDSARYQALGNSMAVPVMKWIGERIDLVEKVMKRKPRVKRRLNIIDVVGTESEEEAEARYAVAV